MVSSAYNMLLGIGIVIAIGLLGWLALIISRDKEKPKGPTLWNLSPDQSHGRAKGVIKEIVPGIGNPRLRITFTPTDVDVEKLKANKTVVQDEVFIINAHRLIPFPRGTLSMDEDIFLSLPEEIDDIPQAAKNTPLGLFAQHLVLTGDLEQQKTAIFKSMTDAQGQMLKDLNGGEISEEWIKTFKGANKEFAEAMLEWFQSRKKTDTFPAPLGGAQHG